ncbi:VOC family protein [Sinomicrobium weinanense]|uniref:VOC family protein n=1 Tax=Sinomicrobium weinanense TaxID=2842200 RepID=A0A926JNF9_9FLAO|nr:VOC family protein [Sinomicrobium weinanense]MBC9794510.1 VOC family protein [Sinomicrobium weinanense]MBU3124417.1 VOC family protein [Sinomicrobium weinanense]
MKLKEIHLLTDDLSGTENFYRKVLGFRVAPGEASLLRIEAGMTTLFFHRSEGLHPVYHLAFDIPNNRLKEAHGQMKEKVHILPVSPGKTIADFTSWNAKSFYFYDNNGNVLEYITRYDLKNVSGRTFDGSSVLHLSEIGLVTDDVPKLASAITSEYGVDLYPKQPPQEHFTVMGDEDGLFILASNRRNWFPTDKRSTAYRTKVIFTTNQRDCEFTLDPEKK